MSVIFTPDSIIYKFIDYIKNTEIIIHDDVKYDNIIYYARKFMDKQWTIDSDIIYTFDTIYNSSNIIDDISKDFEYIIHSFQIICVFILDQFSDNEINATLTNNMETLAIHIIKNTSNLESLYIKLIKESKSRFETTSINIGIMEYILNSI